MGTRWTKLKRLRRYPSLAAGLVIVFLFIALSLYTIIAIPYSEAILLWRGGPGVWDDNPSNARPVWFDLFTRDRLSRTIIVTSEDTGTTRVEPLTDDINLVEIVLPFKYKYDGFPKELNLFTTATFEVSHMPITVSWRTPDGRTITFQEDRLVRTGPATYYISQDIELITQLGNRLPHDALFADPEDEESPLRGDYEMVMQAELREGDELNAKLVVCGEIHGLAGTDHRRRDLMVALLWGAPLALLFGMLPAAAITALAAIFLRFRKARRSDAARAHRSMRAMLLPLFFLVAAAFVLLRALLDVLGLGDPMLPTWGRVIYDARMNGALPKGLHHWVLQPAVLLITTGLGFAMVGYSLRRILKPSLKTVE